MPSEMEYVELLKKHKISLKEMDGDSIIKKLDSPNVKVEGAVALQWRFENMVEKDEKVRKKIDAGIISSFFFSLKGFDGKSSKSFSIIHSSLCNAWKRDQTHFSCEELAFRSCGKNVCIERSTISDCDQRKEN